MTSMQDLAQQATKLAALDRASKTADAKLKAAKKEISETMRHFGVSSVKSESGKATISLVPTNRLTIDGDALLKTDSDIHAEIRNNSVDLSKFKAFVTAGKISVDLAEQVSKIVVVDQVRVTRL